jgi:hypothetical protein
MNCRQPEGLDPILIGRLVFVNTSYEKWSDNPSDTAIEHRGHNEIETIETRRFRILAVVRKRTAQAEDLQQQGCCSCTDERYSP